MLRVPVLVPFERRHLRLRGFRLVFLLPIAVRFAVHSLQRLVVGHVRVALRPRALEVPLAEAVAAKSGEVHHVDVLGVRPRLEMRHELAEGVGLDLGARRRHGEEGVGVSSRVLMRVR